MCIAHDLSVQCGDVENTSTGCSSAFLFAMPANHRVIYVGKRSGGPEALVQLHLALLHWNFTSTLETRRRQVGKSLLPYFREVYAKEFVRFGVRMHKNADYKEFLASAASNDLIILTETWPCRRDVRFDRNSGARQLQYHLTAQDRKFTYDVSHYYIPDAYPEECTALTHTHFMTNTYMNQSPKATLYPYVSPNIAAASQQKFLVSVDSQMPARTVILYDGDAAFDPLQIKPEFRQYLVKAASINPHRLHKLFEVVLCVIDFGMPGAERLVLEASLFGAIVVISDELNGADQLDFPIPERFRLHGRDYDRINIIIAELITLRANGHLHKVVAEFDRFRAFVRGQQVQFLRSVRKYFSDSVHFELRGGDSTCHLIASIFAHIPLATVAVLFEDAAALTSFKAKHYEFTLALASLYLAASLSFRLTSDAIRFPQQSLLRLHWNSNVHFVKSYDFVSILATFIYQDQIIPSISPPAIDCVAPSLDIFIVQRNALIRVPCMSLGHFALRNVVTTSTAELLAISHLTTNSMWKFLLQHL